MLVIDVSFLFLFYFIYCISIPYSHDNDQNLTYNVNKFILEDLTVMHEIVFPLCQHVEIYLLLLNLYCMVFALAKLSVSTHHLSLFRVPWRLDF